jgi:hypothetical protein
VTLINLGGQKLGLSEAGEESRDLEQSRVAIEAVRALLPLLEADPQTAQQVRPVREALAQLQMAYAQEAGAGGAPPPPPGGGPEGGPGGPGPRQQPPPGGRPPRGGLWTPRGSTG